MFETVAPPVRDELADLDLLTWPEPPPDRTWADTAPSGIAALELDVDTADPAGLSDAQLIDAMVGFERQAAWAEARPGPDRRRVRPPPPAGCEGPGRFRSDLRGQPVRPGRGRAAPRPEQTLSQLRAALARAVIEWITPTGHRYRSAPHDYRDDDEPFPQVWAARPPRGRAQTAAPRPGARPATVLTHGGDSEPHARPSGRCRRR